MTRKNFDIGENDVVERVADFQYRKPSAELVTPRMQESHRINKLLDKVGKASIKQIARQTGLSVERILEHVTYFLGLKKQKIALHRRG